MMNKLKATGRLIKTGRGQHGYAEIILLIKRKGLDEARVSFVLETTLDPIIQLNNPVTVEGYIRGYHTRDEKGKWKVDQYFVATKVSPAVGEMEKNFGIKDHFHPQHEFKLFIEGKVNSIIDTSPEWKSLLVAVDGVREIPEIVIMGFKDNVRLNEFKELKKDDTIKAFLNVRTTQKTIKGEVRRFEDIMIEDIAITNRDVQRATPSSKSTDGYFTRNLGEVMEEMPNGQGHVWGPQNIFEETEE